MSSTQFVPNDPRLIGNKFAVGADSGAPRTVSFSEEEMIELGKEMVQWVKEHPDILHLSEWYTIEKMFIYKQWKCFIQCPEFLPYYEVALKMVGRKYLDKDSNVRDGISQRWQRSYFQDLTEREDREKQEDIMRQKELASAVEADVLKNTQASIDQVVAVRVLLEKEQQATTKASDSHSEKSERA